MDLIVVGSKCDQSIDFLCIHLQLIVSQPQSRFECRFELSEVELPLAKNVEMPSLGPSPRVIKNFVGTRINIAGNQRIQCLNTQRITLVVLPFWPVILESISLFLYWSTYNAAKTYNFLMYKGFPSLSISWLAMSDKILADYVLRFALR